MTYGLDCLAVSDEAGHRMSRVECWQKFRAAQPNFACSYVAYHHLRSRGWVPKSGLKFGVDFLAYRKGPAYFHSK